MGRSGTMLERPFPLEVERVSVDDEVIVRRFEAGDVNGRSGHSEDVDVPAAPVDDLNAPITVDEDGIGSTVSGSVDAEVDVELLDAAARQIVDVNIVGAAQRVESDLLDTGQ